MSDRPLITFALIAYNQEKFIREAVEGAFAQTYSPLEIILSDDCSSDATFAIIQEMVADYCGPHSVKTNRNPSNLGIVPHVNRVMEIASGDLILAAAGDDISLPERTAVTHAAWELFGRPHYIFFSIRPFCDEALGNHGFQFRETSVRPHGMVELPGASVLAPAAAWRRELFDLFGPLPTCARTEEKNIAFRAALVGEVIYVNKPLVRYRIHDNNISVIKPSQRKRDRQREARRRALEWHIGRLDAFRVDLGVALERGFVSQGEFVALSEKIEETKSLLREKLRLFQVGGLEKARSVLRLAARASAEKPDFLRKTVTFLRSALVNSFY